MATTLWYLLLCLIAVDGSLSSSQSDPRAKLLAGEGEVEDRFILNNFNLWEDQHGTLVTRDEVMEETMAFIGQLQEDDCNIIQPIPVPVVNCSEDNNTVTTINVTETIVITTLGYPHSNYTPGTKCGWNIKIGAHRTTGTRGALRAETPTSIGNQLLLKCPGLNLAEGDYLDILDLPENGHIEITATKDNFSHRLRGNETKISLISKNGTLGGKGFLCKVSAISTPPKCDACFIETDLIFPWVVQVGPVNAVNCLGVLIDKEWVLTAASCIVKGKMAVEGRPNSLFNTRPVITAIKHPSYNKQTNEHDIGLLRISAVDCKDEEVRPIILPHNVSATYNNRKASSFGKPYRLFSNTYPWQKVPLEIQSDYYCSVLSAVTSAASNTICAVLSNAYLPACQARTGAPLVVKDGTDTIVVGITSKGGGCTNPKLPAYYTRVTDYMPWIAKYVEVCDDCLLPSNDA